jgi:hypothetical protein
MEPAMNPETISIYNHFLTNLSLPIRVAGIAQRELLHQYLFNHAPNPLNRSGKKVFSQNDEDGITLEICKRIFNKPGTFIEFGVGNGLENNTLILLASGWTGGWIGNEDLAFPIPAGGFSRLHYQRGWVTRENCAQLLELSLSKHYDKKTIDVLSIDLDGNDLFILESLLRNQIKPSVIIVEYNAKFPPPIEFTIDYDPSHTWGKDDYMGASLTSFTKLLEPFHYRPICCNITGCNAYFVRFDHLHLFSDVPEDISLIYREPNYELAYMYRRGHATSARTIQRFLSD